MKASHYMCVWEAWHGGTITLHVCGRRFDMEVSLYMCVRGLTWRYHVCGRVDMKDSRSVCRRGFDMDISLRIMCVGIGVDLHMMY